MSSPSITAVHTDRPLGKRKRKGTMPARSAVLKADTKTGMVYGWASVSAKSDGSPLIDRDGDTIPTDVLESAMHGFMQDYRQGGVMHEGEAEGTIVESLVVTAEKLEAMGVPADVAKSIPEGAFIGLQLDPQSETFRKVAAGELGMFSIYGKALIQETA